MSLPEGTDLVTTAAQLDDVIDELLERGRLAVDDDRAADMHVDGPPLGQKRGHVGRGKPLELAHPRGEPSPN